MAHVGLQHLLHNQTTELPPPLPPPLLSTVLPGIPDTSLAANHPSYASKSKRSASICADTLRYTACR